MAWYGCCCPYDPPPCNICTSDAATMTLQISGLVDDACANCDTFDGTYVLSRSGSNACIWLTTRFASGCVGSPFFYGTWINLSLTAKVLAPSANQGWELFIRTSVGYYSDPFIAGYNYATYRWNSGSTADFDCTATRSMTLFTYVPDPTPSENPCDLSSLTITVNP